MNGTQNGTGLKIGIVIARFNEFITKQLLEGALETLTNAGVKESDITVTWVPGAFELPVVAKNLADNTNVNSVICLGAVIKGETDHYDMVAGNAASGILTTSLSTSKPIIFGVLTTDTLEQAINRSGGKSGNAGRHAAEAAIETSTVINQINNK
ncbi:MAG: 6,7-dimethyl-8-ribityllumazine synthase [SAR202 cluster bacterium]|nr:6,7-dimethyl-8-ribityllumazine synthase [SAR202 cluster bacterium]